MTDLASLAIVVDSKDLKPAVAELDKLAASARKTEGAVDNMGREWVRASSGAGKLRMEAARASNAAAAMAKGAQDAAARAVGMGKSAGLAGHHMQNLAFQIQDVVIGLQGGQRPMTVFMQQGSQISMIAAQAGVGLGGMAAAVGKMVVGFAAAHPLLLAAAVAAGLVAAAVGLVTAEINKNSDVTVTWSDTLKATFNVIKAELESKVTGAFRAMGLDVSKVWQTVTNVVKIAMNLVIGAVMAVPKVIASAYGKIGPAFGDAFYSAANKALEALDWLVQQSARPINAIIDALNSAFNTKIPNVVLPSVGRMANPYAGAMSALGSAGANAMLGAFTKDYLGAWGNAISEEAQNIARSREAAEAGEKVGKAVGKAAGKSAAEETAKTYEELLAAKMASFAMPKVLQDIIKAGDTPLSTSGTNVTKGLQDWQAEQERLQKELDDKHHRRMIDNAYQVADIIGGRLGDLIGQMASLADQWSSLGGTGKLLAGAGLGQAAGGGAGGAIGGAIGSKIGEKVLTKGLESIAGGLGMFAGPLGAIAGGLIGGLIGGLLKKTPKASATVSIIAGEAMDVAITGNKAALREAAGNMANGLLSGLADVASQFGAELGNASVSVGMRKKSYVVDPTGAGRTKGAGVINFGKDEAAAMEFAIRDAISDGVFVGLSAGIERLLKGEGNLDKQLQKALSLQGVMNEAKQGADPLGFAIAELDKWKGQMLKIVEEAGEGMTELEAVYAKRRTDIATEEAKRIFEEARPARELEIQIMELEGRTIEALAASRQLEKEAAGASLGTLLDRRNALEDEAEVAAKVAAVAQERAGLENQLLQAMGDTVTLRAQELAALDPLNRATKERIWSIEAETAEITRQNAAREAFLTEQESITVRLFQLWGREDLIRELALSKLDELNRAYMMQVYALEDQKAATEAVAQAASDAARAMEEVAAQQRAVAQERYGLDTRYFQLIGDTTTLRARELELLDPANRARQQEIWSLEDSIALNEAATKAREEALAAQRSAINADIDARNSLIDGYQREANSIGSLVERFNGLAASIREFKSGLFGTSNGTTYAGAYAEFQRTSRMAAMGNESSLQSFTGSAQNFLGVARDNARSLVDYQRAIGLVAGAADAAAAGADGVAKQAAEQLGYLASQIAQLENLNTQSAMQLETLDKVATVQTNEIAPTLDDLLREQKALREDTSTIRKDQQAEAISMIDALYTMARVLSRWDRGDYAAIGNDSDTALTATVSGSVSALITNTGAAQAVPVDTTP